MHKIDKLWAFVADNGPEQGDGIMAAILPNLGSTPLVTGKQSNIKLMLPIAKEVEAKLGKPFRIIEFSVRKDVTADYT